MDKHQSRIFDQKSGKPNKCISLWIQCHDFIFYGSTSGLWNMKKGELRFQCVTCTARFRCRSSLNRHMLTHLKPYKCDQCEEKFKTPKKLARHKGGRSTVWLDLDATDCDFSLCQKRKSSGKQKQKRSHKPWIRLYKWQKITFV